ncbi:hypothetical protein D3C84_1302430 [compost metagenome]
MRFGTVIADHPFQPFQHLTAVLIQFHIYKVNDDDAPGITQPDQPADLLCRQQICLRHSLFQC